MTESRMLVDYTNKKYEKNNKIILKFFYNLKRQI